RAVARLVGWWDGPPLQVVHLAGSAAVERLSGEAHEAPLPWRVLPFEDRMELFYAAADLVVSRAGALTVSELAATGTPAVLVPPSRLGRLNQAANAAHLVQVGGAQLLSDDRLVELPRLVARLAGDAEARGRMASAAAAAARVEAAAHIAKVLQEEGGV
ncbi:MAG: UDP-N-acetylglucosamine--N-acetylmuramyl-(pentapeptide) pyrophosphoryl-undecaprenol N-acetylglucosamine transferase, partial [Actinomycetota bacterium]|nr:UDP-N-acetylglucosamine--N-acetylmuramyl-(pentapeptide) pyrophosphoryl-undecaprenol N-acetylglucosamine transferase [Actinomycetota bacterium]